MVDKIIGPVGPLTPEPEKVPVKQKGGFDELLNELKSINLKVSAHAAKRIETRNIFTTPHIATRLESAVAQAKAKGVKECLILMDGTAYLVDIKNQTLITVIGKDDLRERIFTSIDSVIIG